MRRDPWQHRGYGDGGREAFHLHRGRLKSLFLLRRGRGPQAELSRHAAPDEAH